MRTAQTQSSTQRQEFQIAGGRVLQSVIHLDFALLLQSLSNIDTCAREPARIEHVQVICINGRLIAMAQCVTGKENSERAAMF